MRRTKVIVKGESTSSDSMKKKTARKRRALRELRALLTDRDLISIEKSIEEFREGFKLRSM